MTNCRHVVRLSKENQFSTAEVSIRVERYFTRSKTVCNAIEPVMPSLVIVLPSALRLVLNVLVPPWPVVEPW